VEINLDFFINNIALIFLILFSGILLLFPRLITSGRKNISIKDAVVLINRHPTFLVDVRNAGEFERSRINNSVNIPLDKLAESIDKLKKNSNKTLIIYCQKGFQSAQAVKILNKLGVDSVVSIEGGLEAWRKENLPIIMDS
jgi:rhodanese-related sulfurtransferase